MEVSCGYCPHSAFNEVNCIGSADNSNKCNGSNEHYHEAKGTRISLNVTDKKDLKRKLLKVFACCKDYCHDLIRKNNFI